MLTLLNSDDLVSYLLFNEVFVKSFHSNTNARFWCIFKQTNHVQRLLLSLFMHAICIQALPQSPSKSNPSRLIWGRQKANIDDAIACCTVNVHFYKKQKQDHSTVALTMSGENWSISKIELLVSLESRC